MKKHGLLKKNILDWAVLTGETHITFENFGFISKTILQST